MKFYRWTQYGGTDEPKPPVLWYLDVRLGANSAEKLRKGTRVYDWDPDTTAYYCDEADHVWLKAVGEWGWVVLTKDQRLRYNPLEITALRASAVRVFVLTAGNLRGSEIAAAFERAIPAMCRVLRGQPGPFIARIGKSGKVTVGF